MQATLRALLLACSLAAASADVARATSVLASRSTVPGDDAAAFVELGQRVQHKKGFLGAIAGAAMGALGMGPSYVWKVRTSQSYYPPLGSDEPKDEPQSLGQLAARLTDIDGQHEGRLAVIHDAWEKSRMILQHEAGQRVDANMPESTPPAYDAWVTQAYSNGVLRMDMPDQPHSAPLYDSGAVKGDDKKAYGASLNPSLKGSQAHPATRAEAGGGSGKGSGSA